MRRRQFIAATLLPAFLSPGLVAGDGQGAHGFSKVPRPGQYLFYDDRFPTAWLLSRDCPGTRVPVRGDITSLWNNELKTASLRSPLLLEGITTESFFFCLQRLLQSHNGVHANSQRIGRNLLQWSITTRMRSS